MMQRKTKIAVILILEKHLFMAVCVFNVVFMSSAEQLGVAYQMHNMMFFFQSLYV